MEQGIESLNVCRRQYSCCCLQLCSSDELCVEGKIVIALRGCVFRRCRQQVNDGTATNFMALLRAFHGYLGGIDRLLRGLKLGDAVLKIVECSLRIQLDLVLDAGDVFAACPGKRLGLMDSSSRASTLINRNGQVQRATNLVDRHRWKERARSVLTDSAQGQCGPTRSLGILHLLFRYLQCCLRLLEKRLVLERSREPRL